MNQNKLSIVFPVMNRTQRLIESVPTWIDHSIFDEIVIVDWSSSLPIYDDPLTQNIINHPKVKIIRVQNEEFFISPSFSINVGVSRATYDYILKLDIDYKLVNDKFVNYLHRPITKLHNSFFTTDYKLLNDICLTGFVLFNRQHFHQVNGYNEIFNGWGYEDLHMYSKLSRVAERFIISNLEQFIYHIPHDDTLRNANHVDKSIGIGDNEKLNRARATLPEPPRSEYRVIHTLSKDNKIKYEILERIK